MKKLNSQALKVVPEIAESAVDTPLPRESKSRRILIVDDEKDILTVYKDILTSSPKIIPMRSSRSKTESRGVKASGGVGDETFDLVLVSTGEEAVLEVKKSLNLNKPFAMGFFDVLLGAGIDGIEAVKQIHVLDKNMYAVLVTAYQDRHVDAIQNVFGKEFQDRWDYLNKPFTEGEILQKARNMVSMWNVREHEKEQNQNLNFLKTRLNEGERMLTVAAVARSVGHEFGNILLQIMGRADLARSGKPEEMKKALDTILLATEHASHVLERFKSLAKPHHTYEKSPIDMSLAINEALTLIGHEIANKNVNVEMTFKSLPLVFGSHSTLVQVFMNLIINAIHAMDKMPEGKERNLVFTSTLEAGSLQISVQDSGPGIPKDDMEKIFQPFYTTKGDEGTGLGLSICKEIIEITHGGKMSVKNNPGGGAIFFISIPLNKSEP